MKDFLNNNINVTHEEKIFKIFYIMEDKRTHDKRTFKLMITFKDKKSLLDLVKNYNARTQNNYKFIDFQILEEL